MDAGLFWSGGSILERLPNDVLLSLIVDHVAPSNVGDVVALGATCKSLRSFVWGSRSVWAGVAKVVSATGREYFEPVRTYNLRSPLARCARFHMGYPKCAYYPMLPAVCTAPSRDEWDLMTQDDRWKWFTSSVKPRLCGMCHAVAATEEVDYGELMACLAPHVQPEPIKGVRGYEPSCASCIRSRLVFRHRHYGTSRDERFYSGIPASLFASFGRNTEKGWPKEMRQYAISEVLACAVEVYGSIDAFMEVNATRDAYGKQAAAIDAWEARIAEDARVFLAGRRREGETDAETKRRVFTEMEAAVPEDKVAIRPWALHVDYGVPIPLCQVGAQTINKARARRLGYIEEEKPSEARRSARVKSKQRDDEEPNVSASEGKGGAFVASALKKGGTEGP